VLFEYIHMNNNDTEMGKGKVEEEEKKTRIKMTRHAEKIEIKVTRILYTNVKKKKENKMLLFNKFTTKFLCC